MLLREETPRLLLALLPLNRHTAVLLLHPNLLTEAHRRPANRPTVARHLPSLPTALLLDNNLRTELLRASNHLMALLPDSLLTELRPANRPTAPLSTTLMERHLPANTPMARLLDSSPLTALLRVTTAGPHLPHLSDNPRVPLLARLAGLPSMTRAHSVGTT